MSATAARRELAPVLPMLVAQTRALFTFWFRVPAFSVTSLMLPLVFYTFFGLPNAGKHFPDGLSVGVYLLCSFGAYGVSSVMVFSFGIGVATQRGQKIDLLQRAMPLPAAVVIASNVLTAAIYAVISFLLLGAFAFVVAGIRMAPVTFLEIAEGRVRLLSREPEALLADLFRRGVDIGELEVVGADLEEAFLALTARHQEPVA